MDILSDTEEETMPTRRLVRMANGEIREVVYDVDYEPMERED